MDREALRAAMLKLNFSSDQFFSEIYKKSFTIKNQNQNQNLNKNQNKNKNKNKNQNLNWNRYEN